MATSFPMIVDPGNSSVHGSDETLLPEHVKPAGGRRRSNSKSNEAAQKKKKQPQRGMGVAQLERLRLQERWKKMTEINGPHHFLPAAPFSDPAPLNGAPVHIGAKLFGGGLGTMSSVASSSYSQAMFLQRIGNGGLHGQVRGSSGELHINPYGVGAPNPVLCSGHVVETSKELSSLHYSDSCNVCHKKKRINGENSRSNGVRERYREMFPNGSSSFGSNLGKDPNFFTYNQHSEPNVLPRLSHGGCTTNQEAAEVVAVHRKGSTRGGGVFMEYEFFPGKEGSSSSSYGSFDELMMMKLGSETSSGIGEGSCVTSTGVLQSNSVDLSLKLSY